MAEGFKITFTDGSVEHVTAAEHRREDFIVFYDGNGTEVKTVQMRLVRSILDDAFEGSVRPA